jgi:predicted phage gp36 major capsid-like protein
VDNLVSSTRQTSARRALAYPPKADRHHYVFLNRDGKPVGLAEAGWTGVNSEDDAWSQLYDTIPEYRAAVANGITCRHVDHATYECEIYPLWAPAK